MWRIIANGAVCPGMLQDVVLKSSMTMPWQHFALHHATNSLECLIAEAANTGEGVHASVILLENAQYREHVDIKCCTVLRLGIGMLPLFLADQASNVLSAGGVASEAAKPMLDNLAAHAARSSESGYGYPCVRVPSDNGSNR